MTITEFYSDAPVFATTLTLAYVCSVVAYIYCIVRINRKY